MVTHFKQDSPGCDCCGCSNCAALFALNWKARLCAKGISGLPLAFQLDNDTFISDINTAWNDLTITWSDDSFTLGSISYTAKIYEVSHTGTYNVHSFDGATVEDFTIESCKLTIGAAWTAELPCILKWFWHLSGVINTSSNRHQAIAAGLTPGAGPFLATALTTGGKVRPSTLLASISGDCREADTDYPSQQGLEFIIGLFDTTGPIFAHGFDPLSKLNLVSSSGTPSLPSC